MVGQTSIKVAGVDEVIPTNKGSKLMRGMFANEGAYIFNLDAKENEIYSVVYKDDGGEMILDYQFFEGSAAGLKNGESAKIQISAESWAKIMESEVKKVIAKKYPNVPSTSMKIELDPRNTQASRTCSIGKGYILGSHALACMDPEYRVLITVNDGGK